MRCLIRNITRKGEGGSVHQDRTVEAPRLKLGRGAECDVFLSDLRVALDHAVLTRSEGDSFILHANAASGVRIDQEVRSSTEVTIGDRFSIGGFDLALVAPPPGYDLQLEIEQAGTARGKELEAALRERSVLRLADTGLSRRAWSWTLFLGVLILFGVLPVTGYFLPGLGQVLRSAPLPSDGAWDPGPLAPAHRYFGDDCNACHQAAFVQVSDSACIACHQDTAHHVDPDFHAGLSVTERRCAACHKDHKDGELLVRVDQQLCVDCHADLQAQMADSELADVADFGRDHPEFRPTLLRVVDGQRRDERLALDQDGGLQEASHLFFSHAVHLAETGVETAAGTERVLACADCHTPEPGGRGMAPVGFEAHCRDCHRLSFEADDPGREVAHAAPAAVLLALQDYYSGRALSGAYPAASAPAVVRRARRPGVELTPEERLAALEWVRQTSLEVAGEMLEFRVCANCHQVDRVPTAESDGANPEWTVAPVLVAEQWLPKARFDHARHRAMDCADCHDAQASEDSADVLLPAIASCRDCHGGAGAEDRLASTCVDCHGFHIAAPFSMGQTDE